MADEKDISKDHAVALRYDGSGAPKVTAKGRGEVAKRISEIAKEHDVMHYQSADLVKLLGRLDLGDEIPRELFVAVAEVIAFAYALRAKL